MGRMSHIRRNMIKENTEYRPEQMLCTKILRKMLGKKYEVLTEYPVSNLEPHGGLEVKYCQPDIVIINKDRGIKIAIRLMGEIHDKPKKKIKDQDQKIILMYNGWDVFDFWYNEMPELWNQKKYSEEDAKKSIIRIIKW